MGKMEDLQQKLDECKKSQTFVCDRLDECMRVNDGVKKTMWDNIAPHIKAHVEAKMKDGIVAWNWQSLRDIIAEKAMRSVLGDDYQKHLENL